jgi:hypothetical protein
LIVARCYKRDCGGVTSRLKVGQTAIHQIPTDSALPIGIIDGQVAQDSPSTIVSAEDDPTQFLAIQSHKTQARIAQQISADIRPAVIFAKV